MGENQSVLGFEAVSNYRPPMMDLPGLGPYFGSMTPGVSPPVKGPFGPTPLMLPPGALMGALGIFFLLDGFFLSWVISLLFAGFKQSIQLFLSQLGLS